MIRVVQYAAKGVASSASTTTTGITTRGNLLVALVWTFTDKLGSTPISDSNGNTWVQAIANTGTTEGWGQMWYCLNPSVGAGHTFTLTPTASDFLSIVVFDVEGAASASVLGSTAAASVTGTTRSAGPITAGAGPELFIGGCVTERVVQGTPVIIGAEWWFGIPSLPVGGGGNSGYCAAIMHAAPGESGTFSATFASASNNTTAMVAAFRGAPGGGLLRPVAMSGGLV